MGKGTHFKARLFLEGREVPFSGVELTSMTGAPTVAQISVVPLQLLENIQPKTQVHIFVESLLHFGDVIPRLAFEGEVYGKARSKAQNSRGLTLLAADYSEYWSECKAYFYNPNFLVGKLTELFTGEPPPTTIAGAAGAKTVSGGSTLNSLMISKILAISKLSGSDIVVAVSEIFKTVSGANLFYKLAFNRLRLADRVLIRTSGRLNEFLASLNIEEFLAGFTGRQGGLTSLRDMLLSVMNLVFHEYVGIPFPSFVPLQNKQGTATPKGNTVGSFLFIPDTFTIPPPKCNIVFPNQIVAQNDSEDFRDAPTRFAFRASLPEFVTDNTKIQTYPIQYYPPSLASYMTGTKQVQDSNFTGLLGPGSLLVNKSGQSYASLKYGGAKTSAHGGTALGTKLKEADFLTNEESVKGIFFDNETFVPAIASLANKTSQTARFGFTQSIGAYLFTKKRLMSRNGTVSMHFNPFMVPGFNAMFIDDGNSGQSIMAKVQVLTHHIKNDSASTDAQLGLIRKLDEIDPVSGGSSEPPVPVWFDPSVFGKIDKAGYQAELGYLLANKFITAEDAQQRALITGVTTFPNISKTFYQTLLGCDGATGFIDSTGHPSPIVTVRGLGTYLTAQYQNVRDDDDARDAFVFSFVSRPIPTISQTFAFIGAQPATTVSGANVVPVSTSGSSTEQAATPAGQVVTPQTVFSIPDEFAKFVANSTGVFDGSSGDAAVLAIRRAVVDQYVAQLSTNLTQTGKAFRG